MTTIGDSAVERVVQTDDQKNQAAAEEVRGMILSFLERCKATLNRLNQIVDDAPGLAAEVMDKMGSDKTDAQVVGDKLVAIINAHQATEAEDVVLFPDPPEEEEEEEEEV